MMPKRHAPAPPTARSASRTERKLNPLTSLNSPTHCHEVEQQNKPPPTEECDIWEIASTSTDTDDPPPF